MAMALRSLSRRLSVARGSPFPSPSPSPFVVPRRGLSDAPKAGGVLSEEEKAGENIFVRKLEKEKLEKMARQAEKDGKHVDGSGSGFSSSGLEGGQSEQPPADKSKNIAIAAAVIALIAGGWWYARSGSKAKEEEKH